MLKHGDSIHKENQIGIDALLIRNGSASLLRDYPNSIGWDVVVCRSRFPVKDQTLLRGTLAARDLLIACVYRGAEVGGQRDLHRWATIGTRGRGQTEAFPQSLWPDTKAGRESEMEARENRLSRHKCVSLRSLSSITNDCFDFFYACQYDFMETSSHTQWLNRNDSGVISREWAQNTL